MVEAIVQADREAFSDMRNLMFDREIGTNLLTEFATAEHAKDMIAVCLEILT